MAYVLWLKSKNKVVLRDESAKQHDFPISLYYYAGGDENVSDVLYNTLLNSDRLIGCLWSRDIE